MATEKRLIDANALKGKLIRELNKTGKYTPYECGLDDAISYLDKQPTVDAVEVVHGRKAESVISSTGLMCTACHSDVDRDAVFCKYCGAKMDGGAGV